MFEFITWITTSAYFAKMVDVTRVSCLERCNGQQEHGVWKKRNLKMDTVCLATGQERCPNQDGNFSAAGGFHVENI